MNRPIGPIVPMQHPTPFSPFSPGRWREAIATVAEMGYAGVELAVTDPILLDSQAVMGALHEKGLRLLSITTGQAAGLEGLSLVSEDPAVRRSAIERIKAHMEFADGHNAVVIIGSLRGIEGDPAVLVESLRECAAHRPSVRLALEPLNRYESRLIHTVEDAVSVLDRVGAENLGILFDTFHANIEEISIRDAIHRAGDRLVHVHLADSNRFVPGYGHLDFAEVWRSLDDVGYDRALVLEPLPRPSTEALLQAGRRLGLVAAAD